MPSAATDSTPGSRDRGIPDGYAAVPVAAMELSGRLRLCVLLRTGPKGAGLIGLRDTIDGRAFLGCVIDAAATIHRWIEVWVQNPTGYASMPAIVLEALSNEVLDQRWERTVAALEAVDPGAVVHTGWENQPPAPVWIDPVARLPVHPIDAGAGQPWELCRDEAILAGAELPAYGSSLYRYLYQPKLGGQSPLIPLTPGGPTTPRTRPLESVLDGRTDLLPLNPGGLMFFRAFDAMSLEALTDLLSGRGDPVASDDRLPAALRVRQDDLQDPRGNDAWLFVGQHGKWGRLLEAFHLKLRMLAGAVDAARAAIEQTRRPLLNLTADSFRINMGQAAPGLPRLWTARVVLADGGDAVEVPIRGSEAKYYIPRPRTGSAIYRPLHLSDGARGSATVRLRKTFPEMADGVVVEGTLATQEKFEAAASDLVWLRINFTEGAIDLYARVEREAGLAAGEWRFRSIGQRLEAPMTARLQANEGRPTPASFEVLPVLSTPCDLYSLAVMAARTLLVNATTTLPVALDEALSLARQVALQHDASSALGLRVRAVFESDPRWLAALGPQRLAWDQVSPQQALDLIPIELWMDTLAMIVAMFPGIGPDSACADLGAASQTALHRVFDKVSRDLDSLLLRTRSLIVIDWRYNREIHSVIRGFVAGLSAAPAARGK